MDLRLDRCITLIQGEDRVLGVTVMKDDPAFQPLDLTGYTEIVAVFIKRDGSALEKKLSVTGEVVIVDATCGRIAIALTAANTLALKASDRQSFELALTDAASKTRKVQILGRLNIEAKLEC